MPTTNNRAQVFFTVTNVTDNNSGLYHINDLIGHSIDFWSDGPLSAVSQEYQWQTSVRY